jgi:nitroimidazol reductase NimA-like FMN-containing flavoprotein (pyridoxamine 5'-phosphate oxidase superfamily)
VTATYEANSRTTPTRKPERATHEIEAVNAVLDEALVCHVAYLVDGEPQIVPTLHVRVRDQLYIHGSTGARIMRAGDQVPVSVCVTLTDGIVFARSWFDHSINYRSVIIHGDARLVTDRDEKWNAMVALMNHVAQGRADDSRDANKREFAATAILRIPLKEASLKQRSGPPGVDDLDIDSPHWDGVMPVRAVFGPAIPARDLPLPDYLADYGRGKR